jgi:hypothetical protein
MLESDSIQAGKPYVSAYAEMPGFDAFGMAPQPIAHALEKIIAAA